MERQRTNFAPALIAALLLHLAVLLGGFLAWPWLGKPIQPASVTTVTLVASAPSIPPPARKAPEPAPPSAPEPAPTPVAPPPPAPAPSPKPVPTPPKPAPPPPKPAPAPKPTPLPPKPAPAAEPPKTAPVKAAKPSQDLDLSALASSLDQQTKGDPRKGRGAKGPPKLELSQIERLDQGVSPAVKAQTANAEQAVGARLNRIWNKRCDVEGFRNLDDIQVRFQLAPDGGLQGAPLVISPRKADPVWEAAAEAAVRAVYQAQPFTELPRQTYSQWRSFIAVYQAKEACK